MNHNPITRASCENCHASTEACLSKINLAGHPCCAQCRGSHEDTCPGCGALRQVSRPDGVYTLTVRHGAGCALADAWPEWV